MFDQIKNIVAIVGCQRSGTTLTGQILGAHPNALLIDETDGLYTWFDEVLRGNMNDELLNTLLLKADKKYAGGFKRTQKIAAGQNINKESRNEGLHLSPEITHLVLKAPNLTYSFESLSKLEIPVKIVYPIRDARAVVASMKKLSHIPFVENQIKWINKQPALGLRFEKELQLLESGALSDTEKRAIVWTIKSSLISDFIYYGLPVHTFLYEDLIKDSKNHVKILSSFVGLDMDEAMLSHESVYVGHGPGGTARFRPIDQHSLDSWKDQITDTEIDDISRITKTTMDSLGYSDLKNCA